ncbi:MAG: transposase [Candidatus Cloacimonetes bacterium]|nr:transposase [Candidatus Cloacimonadota bacterium]
MAYTQVQKDNALAKFVEGKALTDISTQLGIPLKTLYNWRKKYEWDSRIRVGNIEIAITVEQEIYKLLQKMIETESIGDPAQVDKLSKLTKVLERINPSRQVYNSLYRFLDGITDYVNRTREPELTKVWQKHLRAIGEHLRQVFAPKES